MIVEVKETQIVTKTYHCVLSEQEASFLVSLMNLISGCPTKSPRKHADSIQNGLAGKVKHYFGDLMENSVHCKDFK